jgi:L-Lysine epsilon oxidase N-terminal/L-lysine epsilon oxidase C-terminal domain
VETSKSRRIRTARIHPAIGVARLGNSEGEDDFFFIGPEVPGVYQFPEGGFRDAQNALKRQGARFRVFGYDEMDRPVGEILEGDAVIEWRVHLKNTKAVGRKFNGVLNPNEDQRNGEWLKAGNDENKLILDPGLHRVSKTDSERRLLCEEFMGVPFDRVLELGRLIYEGDTGRLIVLGGLGRSGTPDENRHPLTKGDFANHDGWFDDTSDGVVTASVTLGNGRSIYVKPAWVVVGPPKFAPELQTIVTLYDTLYQVAIDRGLIPNPFSDPRYLPSFSRDVYPILRRADEMRWVFAKSEIGHTFSTGPGSPEEREHVFRQFRIPSGHPKQPGTGTGRMPYVWSDLYPDAVNATVTPHQYRILESWAAGNFIDDWDGKPPALSFDVTPSGLDRAALEACVGAAFFPGIEVSWKIRDVFRYVEPFRLDPESLSPGDISQQMSLPWQTDFVDCAYEDPYVWWPAQRPIDVRLGQEAGHSVWARPFPSGKGEMDAEAMVKDFYRLGHVLRSADGFLEAGRVEEEPELPFNEHNFRRPGGKRRLRKP